MPINVPESVFDKYYDVIDSTFTIFGVTCQLVFIEQVEEVSNAYNNIPDNRSVNAHRKNQEEFRRENKVFREVERFEDIKLKVYWNSREFFIPRGNIVFPDNSIQTIFFATDLPKINRAKELIAHKSIQDSQSPTRFAKTGQPFPVGLRQDRYYACFWAIV